MASQIKLYEENGFIVLDINGDSEGVKVNLLPVTASQLGQRMAERARDFASKASDDPARTETFKITPTTVPPNIPYLQTLYIPVYGQGPICGKCNNAAYINLGGYSDTDYNWVCLDHTPEDWAGKPSFRLFKHELQAIAAWVEKNK